MKLGALSSLITYHLNTDVPHSGWGTLWCRKKHEAFESKKDVRQLVPGDDEGVHGRKW
jgi:hypothetical protein